VEISCVWVEEMNIIRYVKQNKMCYRKIAHESEQKANKAAKKSTLRSGVQFRSYQCPVCTLWHITKTPLVTKIQQILEKCHVLKSKIMYDSEELAKKAKPDKASFLCRHCNKWHTTSNGKKPDQWN
jgi:hypothetical protein